MHACLSCIHSVDCYKLGGILISDHIFQLFLASKTYLGSVLFRTSAYIGAKQASRVPTGSKQDNSPHSDNVKDVSVLPESELIGPV